MNKQKPKLPDFVLKLYITGATPNSTKAISNIKSFCEKYLPERYKLEVIDVYQRPLVARTAQIVALPLLVKTFPLPEKRLIGNMSDIIKIKTGLELVD